jgi:hypothetical protein
MLSGVAEPGSPAGRRVRPGQPLPPNDRNRAAVELASTPDERLRLHFVEVACACRLDTAAEGRSVYAFRRSRPRLDPAHTIRLLTERLDAKEIPPGDQRIPRSVWPNWAAFVIDALQRRLQQPSFSP